MEIKLSDEQQNALGRLKDFTKSEEDVIVLSGYAGTGKTTEMKLFVQFLEESNIDYRLCAPTHKAKLVLEKLTNRNAVTLHSLCKLSPKLDILRLDFADLQFYSSGAGEIPYRGIVIVDEASMVSDSLYDLLLTYCKNFKSKLCCICDIAQIQPVNNGGLSKVFTNTNIISLTKIFRQTEVNKLSDLLMELRHNVVTSFKSSEDGSINVYNIAKDFVIKAFSDIKKSIELKDLNHSKLICYTNKRITEYNKLFRNSVFKDSKRFHIGELLIGCENYSNSTGEFYNSSDYIITNIASSKKHIAFKELPGLILTLYDGEKEQDIFMLDIDNINITDLEYLCYLIEDIRISAVQAKGRTKGLKWTEYYEIIKSFATPINLTFQDRVIKPKTFDYGYALSAHRSQGSSYNTVYVDMKNLLLDRDQQELRQLQYVALSRTRTNVNIYI